MSLQELLFHSTFNWSFFISSLFCCSPFYLFYPLLFFLVTLILIVSLIQIIFFPFLPLISNNLAHTMQSLFIYYNKIIGVEGYCFSQFLLYFHSGPTHQLWLLLKLVFYSWGDAGNHVWCSEHVALRFNHWDTFPVQCGGIKPQSYST